jgi:hypothetical protein
MINHSTQPLRVFLCHSSGDKPIVRELYQKLVAEGWLDVWLDEEKLFPGMEWNLEIEKAVEAADAIIVCLSSNSVTKEGYVQRELKIALDVALDKPEGTIFVIPLRLDNCEPPRRLRGWQYADYFPENLRTRAYQRMLESLKLRAERLNLSALAQEKIQTPEQGLPPSSKPLIPKIVAPPNATGTRLPVWKYGRVLVIFLLISGFFGPWFEITSCNSQTSSIMTGSDAYYSFISSFNIQLIIPLVVGALFVLILMRLVPWKFGNSNAIIRLERLVAGFAPMVMSIEESFATFAIFGSTKLLWGFLFSIVGVYLAPINILLEQKSTIQKGQRWPRWAWVLAISIIIAIGSLWSVSILVWIYTLFSAKEGG